MPIVQPFRRLLCVAALGLAAAVSPAAAEVSPLRMTPIVRAVQSARPSVVNIQGQKTVADEKGPAGATRQVNGMGTGVVIDPRGYVLTNHHVVDGVRQIRVTLDDGTVDIARVVDYDKRTDLAVIKISVNRSLPTIDLGGSHDLMPGEPVIALGNAYGYEHTVTRGVISALGRDVQVSDTQAYDDLIQTDASINPGNSGGPLLSIEGKMIGLNVAVRAGAQGIGFAIPVDQALDIAAGLMSVERRENKWHGIESVTNQEHDSLVVRRVRKGSPAASSGLRAGDVITRLGDVPVARALDVERALLGRRLGEQLDLRVSRNGEPVSLSLAVARRGQPGSRQVAAKPKTAPPRKANTPGNTAGASPKAWRMLGMRLTEEPKSTFGADLSRYRGGMRVVKVRQGSPAAANGILEGDILVSMHRWETASDEDIRYLINNASLASLDRVKFYVLRDGETLYGAMRVTGSNVRR